MDFLMTRNANRNNVKPVLFGVSFMVMVFLCFVITTSTFVVGCDQYLAGLDSIAHSNSGLWPQWIFSPNLNIGTATSGFALGCFCILPVGEFSFFASAMTLFRYFTLLGLLIAAALYKSTLFALTTTSIFRTGTLVKFRGGFNLLASRALLCYDDFGHGFFLIKKLCSEPLQARYLCGSLYYTGLAGGVK